MQKSVNLLFITFLEPTRNMENHLKKHNVIYKTVRWTTSFVPFYKMILTTPISTVHSPIVACALVARIYIRIFVFRVFSVGDTVWNKQWTHIISDIGWFFLFWHKFLSTDRDKNIGVARDFVWSGRVHFVSPWKYWISSFI